jgi:DNA-binding MarR family transcriptional regulator
MTSPRETAMLVMDNIPSLMRLLRMKFREKRVGRLSMAQFRTLAFVDVEQGASLSEVSHHIGLGLPSMSKQVDALVTRGLLERSVHGEDRRRICLALTPLGKQELDEAYRHTQSFFTEKFSELTETERSQIAEAFEQMQKLFALKPGTSLLKSPGVSNSPDIQ